MKSKLFKKIVAGLVTVAMASQFAFVLPITASAAANSEDTSIFLDFESNTVGTEPTAAYDSAKYRPVKDGSGEDVGVSTYSASAGRSDAYHYISGDDTNKYLVYKTVDTAGYTGWYNGFMDLTSYHATTASAANQSFIYEAKVRFVENDVSFNIADASNTKTDGRYATVIASMDFADGVVTCNATGATLADNKYENISRDKWYKVSIVYSVNNYVSFKLQECNEDGTLTDIGFCSGTPKTDTDTIGYVGFSNSVKNSTTVAYLDDISWTTIAPSKDFVITLDGDAAIEKETSEILTKQYTISNVLHNAADQIEIPANTIGAQWSLEDEKGLPVDAGTGFSIDQTGLLSANGATVKGTYQYQVVVKSGSEQTGYSEARMPVTITVKESTSQYYDVTVKYMDNIKNEEVKPARVIAAQKEGDTVSAFESDFETFDAVASDQKLYRYTYYAEQSDPIIVVGADKTVITLSFTPVLITDVTINFLDKETQQPIKQAVTVGGLLSGTTYEIDSKYLASISSGTTIYKLDNDSETAVMVTENDQVNLYFNPLENEYYMYEDFESYDIGDMAGIAGAYPGNSSVADVTGVGGQGKAFKIEAEKVNACRIAIKELPQAIELGSKVNIEYDWYGGTRPNATKGAGADITFIDNEGNSVVTIEQQDAGLRYYWGGKAELAGNSDTVNWGVNANEGNAANISSDISGANKWYHISIVINKPAKTMQITATDKSSGISGTVDVDISSMTGSSIAKIRFASDKTNTSYVDNMQIYKKAGEYLLTTFVQDSLDTWEKVLGEPEYTYDVNDQSESYVMIKGNSEIKSPAFEAKNTIATEYGLNINKNSGDFTSKLLNGTDVVATYGIKDGKFVVNGIELPNQPNSGTTTVETPVYTYENNKMEAEVINKTGSDINAVLYVAEYASDGTLKGIKMSDGTLISNGATSKISVEYTKDENTTIDAFVWDGMKPIYASYSVNPQNKKTVQNEETGLSGWYTITSSINTESGKLAVAVSDGTESYVNTDISITPCAQITNISFEIGSENGLSELKVIEGTPKTISISAEDILNVQDGENSIDIIATAVYKVPTKQTIVDYDWTLDAVNKSGITLEKKNSDAATLTATEDAKAQVVTITAANGKISASKKIRIATSANNVIFETYANNALIPFEGKTSVAFSAKAVDGNMQELEGRTIVFDLCDEALNPIQAAGVTIDSATGLLTVDSNAQAGVVYVRATESQEELYEVIKVNVHGYKFDFGYANTDETQHVKDGYISVTSNDVYNADKGYGLSASTAGMTSEEKTASSDLLLADYLQAGQKFKFFVDLPNGEYTITSVHKGTILTGAATEESGLSDLIIGEAKTSIQNETTLQEVTFVASVVNGQLDLNFDTALNVEYVYSNAGDKNVVNSNIKPAVASVEITKLRDLPTENAEKPTWYIVGDSTSKNSAPIYGYGNVAQQYIGDLATVSNQGSAGRSLLSYYCQNKFGFVLQNVKPGDVVTFGMGINNKGDTNESFNYQMEYMIKGVQQRGGIAIVLTPTPKGMSDTQSSWNDAAGKFNYRNEQYDSLEQLANKMNAAFINLDHLGADALNKSLEKYTDLSERKAAAKAYWSDHNHMYQACAKIVSSVLVEAMVDILVQNNGWVDTRS